MQVRRVRQVNENEAAAVILFNILMALLINAVPAYGISRLGWSVPTVLVLYWLENLSVALLTMLRIALHRHWTRKRGHWRAQTNTKFQSGDGKMMSAKTFFGEYAGFSLIFTLAHGVFVLAICAILAQQYPGEPRWHVSYEQLRQGGAWMAAFLVLDLLVDLPRLHHGTFAWLKQNVEKRMGRVLILHFAIIFGMFIMFATESPFSVVYVLIGLKTLTDVVSASSTKTTVPSQPPSWMLKMADKAPSGKGVNAAALTKQWQDKLASDKQQAIDDEQVMPQL
jgi:hypothetical protein